MGKRKDKFIEKDKLSEHLKIINKVLFKIKLRNKLFGCEYKSSIKKKDIKGTLRSTSNRFKIIVNKQFFRMDVRVEQNQKLEQQESTVKFGKFMFN